MVRRKVEGVFKKQRQTVLVAVRLRCPRARHQVGIPAIARTRCGARDAHVRSGRSLPLLS